jgi:DNA primase
MPTKIETIKAKIPLAPYVAKYTNGLKATGPNFFLGKCPFHQKPDDPPNKRKFWVNTRHNICGCFSPNCRAYCNQHEDPRSKPLDIINFYALLTGCSNQEAIEYFAKQIEVR